MTWLQQLKNETRPPQALPKLTKVPADPLLSVLSVPTPGDSEKCTTRPVVKWRLPDHPPNAWATTIGPPGVSRSELTRDILARWPEAVFQNTSTHSSGGAM